jgi:hypothetical protein
MKNKSQYEMELEYQVQLMREIDSVSAGRELALALLEYGRLVAAGRLSRAEKENWVRALSSLATEIKEDLGRLESFKWVYIASLARQDDRRGVAGAIIELCAERLPYLSDYLLVTMDELREKVRELKEAMPDIRAKVLG